VKKPKKSIFKARARTGISKAEPAAFDSDDQNAPLYIATHEAAHAVAAVLLGLRLRSVDIKTLPLDRDHVSAGFTDTGEIVRSEIAGKGEAAVKAELITSLVGPLAELRVNPRFYDYKHVASFDFQKANELARLAVVDPTQTDEEGYALAEERERTEPLARALYDSAFTAAAKLVEAHYPIISKVAQLLMARRELSGEEVRAVVEELTNGALPSHRPSVGAADVASRRNALCPPSSSS
jgi:hypothetical protein